MAGLDYCLLRTDYEKLYQGYLDLVNDGSDVSEYLRKLAEDAFSSGMEYSAPLRTLQEILIKNPPSKSLISDSVLDEAKDKLEEKLFRSILSTISGLFENGHRYIGLSIYNSTWDDSIEFYY